MNKIKANIIADSVNQFGNRLTTFVVTFPRIVLAELNTHRMFSRNSASSRAIPFKRMLEVVKTEPFIPIKFMKEHKGMQGTEFITDEDGINQATSYWLKARDEAVNWAEGLSNQGITKQVCNRLLEPFLYHTAIITASEWENFFALRAHPDAEIHIQELAHKMLDAYGVSTPKVLQPGEWHVPFGEKFDIQRIIDGEAFSKEFDGYAFGASGDIEPYIDEYKVKIATARCARVSYLNFEGKDDYEADIKLHDTLLKSGHMSPFEHCAKAMTNKQYTAHKVRGIYNGDKLGICGNFRGFIQYRKLIPGENKKDERVKRKNMEGA